MKETETAEASATVAGGKQENSPQDVWNAQRRAAGASATPWSRDTVAVNDASP